MTQLASRPAAAPGTSGPAPLRTAPMTPQTVLSRTVRYVLLSLISVVVLTPFAWMALSSLKRNNEVFTAPITWFPDEWQWHNYIDIWTKADMSTWLGTRSSCRSRSPPAGAHRLVRGLRLQPHPLPGRDALFLVYIGTIAVPWQAYMIPQFKLLSEVGWPTPGCRSSCCGRSAPRRVPHEAVLRHRPRGALGIARIDGLTEFGIYRRIMLPLSVPSISALAILTFTNTWNDYMGPLIYLRSPDLWTIQLGLKTFIGQYNADYAAIMTGSVLSVLPIAVVFALGQKYFVQGIASSGLKG